MTTEHFFRSVVLREKAYHVSDDTAPVKLNQNENPYSPPAELTEALVADFRQFALNRYPSVFPDELNKKLAEHLGVHPDCILTGHGSNELIYSSLWAILGYGDRVFIPSPSFSLYGTVAGFCEASVLSVLPDEHTLRHDPVVLEEELIRHQPKLTILCNPNNPSAQVIPHADLTNLIQKAAGLVWLDEAYIDYSVNPTLVPVLDDYRNLIILRTFSKAYGLAGIRLGYLLGSPEVMIQLRKTKVPFTVDAFSQRVGIRLLEHQDWVESVTRQILAERSRLASELSRLSGLRLFETDTNFFIFKVLEKTAASVFRELVNGGVLVRNVSGYPAMADCLRVNVGTPEENDHFLKTMKMIFPAN